MLLPFNLLAQALEVRAGLRQTQLGRFTLRRIHPGRAFPPTPGGATRQHPDHLELLHQLARCIRLGWLRVLSLRPQEQAGILDQALTQLWRTVTPRRIHLPDLAGSELLLAEHFRQGLTVLSTHPDHGNQVLHRHLARDLASTDTFLDRCG